MTGALFPTTPTPRTDAAIIRDKMILSEVGLLEIVDAGTCRQLERDLAAAQEARQRAEALAESFRKDAERYRYIKDDRRGKFVEALALRDAENWDAAIDSAKERANG